MIVKRQEKPSHAVRPRRLSARGFTIVSTAVSVMVAGIMLAGGWMSYVSMLRQWKIGNAEREMDQYAQAAMQELTNDVSWSAAGVQLVGGSRNTRWKFMFDDQFPNQFNVNSTGTWERSNIGARRDPQNFVVFNFSPTAGLMIGGEVPPWAGNRWHSEYHWMGRAPRRGETMTFDRRDHMTVEGMTMEWNLFPQYRYNTIADRVRRQGVVQVSLLMQYSYQATQVNSDVGLYGGYYVRERQYSTQISVKNWDTEGNIYRDSLIAHAG